MHSSLDASLRQLEPFGQRPQFAEVRRVGRGSGEVLERNSWCSSMHSRRQRCAGAGVDPHPSWRRAQPRQRARQAGLDGEIQRLSRLAAIPQSGGWPRAAVPPPAPANFGTSGVLPPDAVRLGAAAMAARRAAASAPGWQEGVRKGRRGPGVAMSGKWTQACRQGQARAVEHLCGTEGVPVWHLVWRMLCSLQPADAHFIARRMTASAANAARNSWYCRMCGVSLWRRSDRGVARSHPCRSHEQDAPTGNRLASLT